MDIFPVKPVRWGSSCGTNEGRQLKGNYRSTSTWKVAAEEDGGPSLLKKEESLNTKL